MLRHFLQAARTERLHVVGALVMAAAGCAAAPDDGPAGEALGRSNAVTINGACGLGDEVLAADVLTVADIPQLSPLQRSQIILAVRESAHTDVTTIEQAFQRVDDHVFNSLIWRDETFNQFYVEIEYGVGDNSYGAIFYWGTDALAGAIHDGDPAECGPADFHYDRGDTAPECSGFLTYVNTATFAALDAYLPSNVAQAVVTARSTRPFDSVVAVAGVAGVAESRLQQLLAAARTAGLVGPSCSGIHDQIALSIDETTTTVGLVNEASREELRGVLALLINETVVGTLIANRPLASAVALSGVAGVGPAVLRTLRNAATFRRPYEELVDAVNALDHPDAQIRLDRHFEWLPLVTGAQDFRSMICFGIAPSLLPAGAVNRAQLAGGNEVVENFAEAVLNANFLGELTLDPHPGYGDLEYRTFNRSFFGCYIDTHRNPWVYDRQTFYVDTQTGFGLLIMSHYVE